MFVVGKNKLVITMSVLDKEITNEILHTQSLV